jgi:hypothetical protein
MSLTVVACTALAAGAAGDEKYKSKDGKFAVLFPTGAKAETETKKVGISEVNLTKAQGEGKAFVVAYTDLPAAVKDVPAKAVLENAARTHAKQTGGKTVTSKEFEYGPDKMPGYELVTDKDGNKIKTQIVLAGARLYVVTVAGPKDFATGKGGAAFLDSFEITK